MNISPSQPTQFSASHQSIVTAAKGGGIKLFGTLFAYAVRFALGILMARLMGAEQYGLYSLADTAFYVLVSLTMLGLFYALIRYIPIFLSRQDEESLWGTLQVGLGYSFIASVLAGSGLFIFAKPIAMMIFNELRLVPVLEVVAVALPFGTLVSMLTAAIRGFNQLQYNVIAEDIFLSLIKLVLVAVFAIAGLNAVRAMAAHALGTMATCLMLFFFLHRLFPLNRPWRMALRNPKEMFKFSAPNYGSDLLSLFGGNLQTLLLGMLNTVSSVGIFTAAARINLIGTMFYSSVNASAEPIVSELHSKAEYQQLGHFYQSVTKWTLSVNLPLFVITLLFAKPILSIFGSDFIKGSVALIILSCGSLVDSGTGINAAIITMTGKSWLNIVNTSIWLTLQLVLSFLLVPGLGIIGAAIAMGASRAVINIARTLEVFVLYRLSPYNKSFVKPIIASTLSAIVAYVLAYWIFEGETFIGTVVSMGGLVGTYAGAMLLLGISQEDRMILDRLYSRLSRVAVLARFAKQ
jgi:O-antigen/teichoic acid export membrane protein